MSFEGQHALLRSRRLIAGLLRGGHAPLPPRYGCANLKIEKPSYHMAKSVSGKDEVNRVF